MLHHIITCSHMPIPMNAEGYQVCWVWKGVSEHHEVGWDHDELKHRNSYTAGLVWTERVMPPVAMQEATDVCPPGQT